MQAILMKFGASWRSVQTTNDELAQACGVIHHGTCDCLDTSRIKLVECFCDWMNAPIPGGQASLSTARKICVPVIDLLVQCRELFGKLRTTAACADAVDIERTKRFNPCHREMSITDVVNRS